MKLALLTLAASICVFASSQVAAQSASLGNWDATDDECLVSIYFHADGTARVQNMLAGGEANDSTAHWTFVGTTLHLTFDTVQGSIDGVMTDSRHLNATMHWVDASTQIAHDDPCHFEKE